MVFDAHSLAASGKTRLPGLLYPKSPERYIGDQILQCQRGFGDSYRISVSKTRPWPPGRIREGPLMDDSAPLGAAGNRWRNGSKRVRWSDMDEHGG